MATTSGSDVQKGNFVEMQRPIGSTSSKDVEASDEFAADINGQKTGTSADAKDMHRLGKTQEMKRNFRSVSILGLSSLTMATWAAFLGSCNFSMLNGGLAGTVWIFLAVWLFTIPISLSLAEMASMAPVRIIASTALSWTVATDAEYRPRAANTTGLPSLRHHTCRSL